MSRLGLVNKIQGGFKQTPSKSKGFPTPSESKGFPTLELSMQCGKALWPTWIREGKRWLGIQFPSWTFLTFSCAHEFSLFDNPTVLKIKKQYYLVTSIDACTSYYVSKMHDVYMWSTSYPILHAVWCRGEGVWRMIYDHQATVTMDTIIRVLPLFCT